MRTCSCTDSSRPVERRGSARAIRIAAFVDVSANVPVVAWLVPLEAYTPQTHDGTHQTHLFTLRAAQCVRSRQKRRGMEAEREREERDLPVFGCPGVSQIHVMH